VSQADGSMAVLGRRVLGEERLDTPTGHLLTTATLQQPPSHSPMADHVAPLEAVVEQL